MAKQSTAEYYRKNPPARKKRLKQQKEYMKGKGGEIRDRADALNIKLGTKGNHDGLDAAHYKGSKTEGRLQKPSINRKSRLKVRKNVKSKGS